jgi:hypothetical protein
MERANNGHGAVPDSLDGDIGADCPAGVVALIICLERVAAVARLSHQGELPKSRFLSMIAALVLGLVLFAPPEAAEGRKGGKPSATKKTKTTNKKSPRRKPLCPARFPR